MADPFTIAVSVAGLAGFGVQLVQVLNQYAGSATDSKGRIRAISNDIKLTIEVLNVFKNNLELEVHRQCMSDGAENLAMEAIQMCEDIFRKIGKLLHGAGGKPGVTNSTGNQSNPAQIDPSISFLQKLKWPLVEPKLDILRGNLEKVKTTLQLLMSVVTFAVMSKMHSDRGSIDRQKAEIERLKLEKIEADTKLRLLLQAYPHLDENMNTTDQGLTLPVGQRIGRSDIPCYSSVPGMFSGAFGESAVAVPSPSVYSSFGAFNLAIASPPVHPTPVHQSGNSRIGTTDAQSTEYQFEFLPQKSGPINLPNSFAMRSTPSSTEPPMDILHADYVACLQQLDVLQSKLESALSELFHTTRGSNGEIQSDATTLNWSERYDTHGKVIKEAQSTIDVFEDRLIHGPLKGALRRRARSELAMSQQPTFESDFWLDAVAQGESQPAKDEVSSFPQRERVSFEFIPYAGKASERTHHSRGRIRQHIMRNYAFDRNLNATGAGSRPSSVSAQPLPPDLRQLEYQQRIIHEPTPDQFWQLPQDVEYQDQPQLQPSQFSIFSPDYLNTMAAQSARDTSDSIEQQQSLEYSCGRPLSVDDGKQEAEAEERSPAKRRMEVQQDEEGQEPLKKRLAQHMDITQPPANQVFNLAEDETYTTSDIDDLVPLPGDSLWSEGTLPTVNDLLRLWTK